MIHNHIRILFSLSLLVVGTLAAFVASAVDHQSGSEPYEAVSALPIPIEAPSQTVLGQPYTFPEGTPLIKTFKITIEPGMKTGPHKHAIPLIAYVFSGTLGVDYGSRGKRSFAAGQAYVEAIDWCHVGYAVGSQAVGILGIYLGQQDPDQIKPEPCGAALARLGPSFLPVFERLPVEESVEKRSKKMSDHRSPGFHHHCSLDEELDDVNYKDNAEQPAGNRSQPTGGPQKGEDAARVEDPASDLILLHRGILGQVGSSLPAPIDRDPAELSDAQRRSTGIDSLPRTLGEALTPFRADPILLDMLGEPLARSYAAVKAGEIAALNGVALDGEVSRLVEI